MRRDRRNAPRAASALALCGLLAQLSGCAATEPVAAVRDYLDEQTAATVTVAGSGLVFARSRTEYAINARDYVTVVPVDVNRTGAHQLYFYCYVWSTIDKPNASEPADQFQLVADGRQIPLAPASATPRALGLGEQPVEPPALNARVVVAATTREVLQFLMKAKDLAVVGTRNGLTERYDLWSDQRAGIEAFLEGPIPVR